MTNVKLCCLVLSALVLALPVLPAPAMSEPASKGSNAKSSDAPKPKKKAGRRSFKENEEADTARPAPTTLENALTAQPTVPGGPGGPQPDPITRGQGDRPNTN